MKTISRLCAGLSSYVYLFAGLLVFLGWLLPNHYYPWVAFHNDFLVVLGFLSLGVAVFCLQPERLLKMEAVPWPVLVLAAVATVPMLQYGVGKIHFFGDALLASCYLGGLSLAYVMGGLLPAGKQASNNGAVVEAIAMVFLAGAFCSFVLATCQWLGVWGSIWITDMPLGGRPYANLAQPNNLATLLWLGVASAVYLRECGKLSAALTLLFVLLLLAGIAMAGSRTSLLVMVFVAGWLLWQPQRLALKCSRVQVCGGVVVFIALWLGWSSLSDLLYLSAHSIAERQDMSRLGIWAQMFDATLREPLFGYGWNQASFAQIAVVAEHVAAVAVEHSHNIVLDLLVWNGLVLGGVLALLLAWWMLSRLWYCRDTGAWYGLLVIGVVGIHGLLEFPLEYAYFLLPVGLCAGIVDRVHPVKKVMLPHLLFSLSVLVGVVLSGQIFIEYKALEDDSRRMRLEARGLAVAPKEERNIVLLTQLAAFQKFAATEATENMSAAEITWMEVVAHRYPYPPALFRYALALGLNGKYQEAELELLRLKKLHNTERYEEAVQGWDSLSERYPDLRKVTLP